MIKEMTILDVRIEDQITQYINAALLRGVKFEVNAIGNWCRDYLPRVQ